MNSMETTTIPFEADGTAVTDISKIPVGSSAISLEIPMKESKPKPKRIGDMMYFPDTGELVPVRKLNKRK